MPLQQEWRRSQENYWASAYTSARSLTYFSNGQMSLRSILHKLPRIQGGRVWCVSPGEEAGQYRILSTSRNPKEAPQLSGCNLLLSPLSPTTKTKRKKFTAAEILQKLYTAGTCKLPPKTTFKKYWEQENLDSSFKDAKELLRKACTLTFPDPNRPLAITGDASQYAIGCVLEQHDGANWRPPSFFSRHLDKA